MPITRADVFKTLQTRYPDHELSGYFSFIESLPTLTFGGHRHHIAPSSQFKDLKKVAANIVRLSVGDHIRAHHLLSPAIALPSEWIGTATSAGSFGGKIGGVVQGNRNAASGHMSRLGKTGIGGKIGGLIAGKKNVESGHWARISKLGGFVGGKIGGKKNVESGHWDKIRVLGMHCRWHVNRGIKICGNCVGFK